MFKQFMLRSQGRWHGSEFLFSCFMLCLFSVNERTSLLIFSSYSNFFFFPALPSLDLVHYISCNNSLKLEFAQVGGVCLHPWTHDLSLFWHVASYSLWLWDLIFYVLLYMWWCEPWHGSSTSHISADSLLTLQPLFRSLLKCVCCLLWQAISKEKSRLYHIFQVYLYYCILVGLEDLLAYSVFFWLKENS